MTAKQFRENELEFLSRMFTSAEQRYRRADWLKCHFDALQWRCEFGKSGSFDLDFGRLISFGILSVDVVATCKYWLIVASRPSEGALAKSLASQYAIVTMCLTWIDYLILNQKYFGFRELGFSAFTVNLFHGALQEMLSDNSRVNAAYRYKERVFAAALEGGKSIGLAQVHEIIEQYPALALLPDDREGFSSEEVLSMRAWLQHSGHLKWSGQQSFQLNAKSISEMLFGWTLRGVGASKPVVTLLASESIRKRNRKGRRFEGVPNSLKGQLERPSKAASMSALHCIRSFRVMQDAALQTDWIPSYSVIDASEAATAEGADGRFATLPAPVVFYALRHAIEFSERYGDAIVDSYCNLLANAKQARKHPNELSEVTVRSSIALPLRELGVNNWNTIERSRDAFTRFAEESEDFSSINLFTLVRVLYGATGVIVGTTMARRVGELSMLDSLHLLDVAKEYLIFDNAKSTKEVAGLREREARPVIHITAKSISRLQRIHHVLREYGHINKGSKLFQYPKGEDLTKLTRADEKGIFRVLDMFCDYVEMPIVEGRRYYIRHHQLRRFFAMIFFWHSSFEGLHVLRWFLGHTDIEMVYRYITESIPGQVLRHIKAHYAASHISAHDDLADYLKQRFGINKYAFLAPEKLEEYIVVLLEEGKVSIEPVFFTAEHGRDHKIMVKVIQHGK